MTAMTSRALAHHRLAMDGMRGAFVVMRAVREHGVAVDFEVVEANSIMRRSFKGVCDQVVGTRMSELNRFADNTRLDDLYRQALASGKHLNVKSRVNLTDGRNGWSDVNVVTVDRDMIAVFATDITAAGRDAPRVGARAGSLREPDHPFERSRVRDRRRGRDRLRAAVGHELPRLQPTTSSAHRCRRWRRSTTTRPRPGSTRFARCRPGPRPDPSPCTSSRTTAASTRATSRPRIAPTNPVSVASC